MSTSAPRLPSEEPSLLLDELYRGYRREALGVARGLLGRRDEAEDAVQDAFLNAGRALARGTVPVEPRAWILAIARNVCFGRLRERGERAREVPLVAETHAAAEADGPRAAEIGAALRKLPSVQRDVLVQRELEGRPLREIAHRLDLTQTAVSAHLFRARASLREELEADERPLRCDDVPQLVTLHRRGLVEPAQRRLLRAHLRACQTCATVARRLRAARPLLGLGPDLVLRGIAWLGRAGAAAKVAAGTGAAVVGVGVVVDLVGPPERSVPGPSAAPPVTLESPRPRPAPPAALVLPRERPASAAPVPRLAAAARRRSTESPAQAPTRAALPVGPAAAPAAVSAPAPTAETPRDSVAVTPAPPQPPGMPPPPDLPGAPSPPALEVELPPPPELPLLPDLPLPQLPPIPAAPDVSVQPTVDAVGDAAESALDRLPVDVGPAVPPAPPPPAPLDGLLP